jgi:hypothetical protein
MSVTWHNVYTDESIGFHASAEYAASFGTQFGPDWLRVEQRWNGHWLRPCVGISNDHASHVRMERIDRRADGFTVKWSTLEPRQ